MAYANWLVPSKTQGSGNDTVNVTAGTDNTGRSPRQTAMTFKAANCEDVVRNVIQAGKPEFVTIQSAKSVSKDGVPTLTIEGTTNSSKLTFSLASGGSGSKRAPCIPVLHMPRETASLLRKKGIGCAAVFATDGTIRAGIYEDALCAEGIRPVYPGQEGQRLLMKMIYDHIKAGKEDLTGLKPSADALLREMKDAGARCIILGCTELPIAFELLGRTEDTFDPTSILARAAIKASGYEVN